MADRNQRQHFWMITSLITFEKDDVTQQSHMNGVVETPFKSVSQTVLETVTTSMLTRLHNEAGADAKITGHTFLNVSWLGHMTSSEFNDTKENAKA
jgi:hypothetical protein